MRTPLAPRRRAHRLGSHPADAGYAVLPPVTPAQLEPSDPGGVPPATDGHALGESSFDGGYVIAHYGSQNADGVDAIHLELRRTRSTDTLKTARVLADAIAAFYGSIRVPPPHMLLPPRRTHVHRRQNRPKHADFLAT